MINPYTVIQLYLNNLYLKKSSLSTHSSFYKYASFELFLQHLIHYMSLKKRDPEDIYDKFIKGLKLWPLPKNANPYKIIPLKWKHALLSISKNNPNTLKKLIKSFSLTPDLLNKLIMPIEDLAELSNMPKHNFLQYISDNDHSYTQKN